MAGINLLDPSLGIQNVMNMPDIGALPRAREMAVNVLSEAGLDELYAPRNARQLLEQALCPEVGDGSLLNPETFSGTLKSCVTALDSTGDTSVKDMVERELKPLLQNGDLLQAYMGLMIGG